MKSETKGGERGLDRIIAEVRNQSVDEQVMEQAARRVWAQVAQLSPSTAATAPAHIGKIRSCADFQALMQAYLAKTLPNRLPCCSKTMFTSASLAGGRSTRRAPVRGESRPWLGSNRQGRFAPVGEWRGRWPRCWC